MIDQLILYDQALVTWLNDNVAPLAKGRTTQLLIATARKAYAEVTTGRVVDNETLTFPRMSLTRVERIVDPTRFNSNRVRRLGWCSTPVQKRLRSANFPTPIQIIYQLDLWTRFVSEMNLWEQKILMSFAPDYLYLKVRPDDVYGDKWYPTIIEGGVSDNSDLEPGEGERAIRRTISLRSDGWLFDQDFDPTSVVKRLQLEWYDEDGTELFDRTFLPPLETIGQGDGNQTSWPSIQLDRPPVLEHTPVIQTICGGTTELTQDDGSGNLVGDRSSGTINYTTGVISITYTVAPDALEDITITYFTDLS